VIPRVRPTSWAASSGRFRPEGGWTAGLWHPVHAPCARLSPHALDARASRVMCSSKHTTFDARGTFHRQAPCRPAFAGRVGLQPRSRLCRHRADCQRPFTLRSLARGGLDPNPLGFIQGRGPDAACRLLQSIRPRAPPRDRPNPVHLWRGRPRFRLARSAPRKACPRSGWRTRMGDAKREPSRPGTGAKRLHLPRRSLAAGA
jgi:hypothetical protein